MSTARAGQLGLGVLLALMAGCAAPAGGPPGSASPATPPTRDAGPTAAGTPAVPTTGRDSPRPASAKPTPASPGGTVGPLLPPAALLATGLAGSVAGTLGSWTFETNGSDSPWLPAASLGEVQVATGGRLVVRFAGGEPIGAWSAQVADEQDVHGERPSDAGGREAAEPALDQVELELLQPGRWVLAVRLELADGRGDATWYWLVSVR